MASDSIDPDRFREIRRKLTEEFNKPIPDDDIRKAMPGVFFRRSAVIELTKLNGTRFTLNPELIETIEATPDSVIMLVTGRKYLVKESVDEIKGKCLEYRRSLGLRSPGEGGGR